MRITLVPHVKQQPVPREVKHIVQGDREFDDPQIGREVPPGLHDLPADRLADLSRKHRQLADGEFLQIGRAFEAGKDLQVHWSELPSIRVTARRALVLPL